jgi:hypothetical protein
MKELLQAFSPNRAFSRKAVMTLVTIQLMMIVLLWFNSPWVLLPKPGEVWESLGELYQQGLPQHLVTSFFLNLESIGIASVLSLGLAYLTVMPFFRPVIVVAEQTPVPVHGGAHVLLHRRDQQWLPTEDSAARVLCKRVLRDQHGRCHRFHTERRVRPSPYNAHGRVESGMGGHHPRPDR